MAEFRIFDILPRYAEKFSKPDALASKVNGQWTKISTASYIENSNNISYGLLALGINKEDKIASISNNRYEWNFLDMGILQIGAVHVPIYPTISEAEYKFILNDAGVKYVFVSDAALFQKIMNIVKDVPSIKGVFTFDKVDGAKHWTEVVELGKQHADTSKLDTIKANIKASDLATLIYTSGTTGNPKGVMLSHLNIISNVMDSIDLVPQDTKKALSFLPLCHVYERMLCYLYQHLGISVYYAESMDKIADNIREVQPNIFGTVPRLLEKVYDKIVAKGEDLKGIKKTLFFWALNLGLKYELNRANGWWYEFKLKIANKLIFSKWREALGNEIKVIVSGGAALQPRLARVFWSAHIPVLEGYGLTETSPVIAVNNLDPKKIKFGTVGPMLKSVQVKFADDGEILCKGPNIMMGYYKRPDLTAEAIDKDGWFHTGDIGVMEDGIFLKITDRKKELFKTSGGKYIAPQPIENKFKESRFIEQVMVIGDGKKFASAILVPAFEYIKTWCATQGINCSSKEEIVKNQQVIKRLQEEVDMLNKNFGHVEQIKKFELLTDEWTTNSGELTPTLKLKRKYILNKYQDVIEKIYKD